MITSSSVIMEAARMPSAAFFAPLITTSPTSGLPPPKEFDLLYKLAQNEHIVLSRDKLLETVWGYRYCGDARTVDTHIKSLREHIGPYRKLIQTVWGVGYKFEKTDEN